MLNKFKILITEIKNNDEKYLITGYADVDRFKKNGKRKQKI